MNCSDDGFNILFLVFHRIGFFLEEKPRLFKCPNCQNTTNITLFFCLGLKVQGPGPSVEARRTVFVSAHISACCFFPLLFPEKKQPLCQQTKIRLLTLDVVYQILHLPIIHLVSRVQACACVVALCVCLE